MVTIDPDGDTPPYEQLRIQLARLVADQELEPGAKLPTVRKLAADLGLAPNTVARTYRELEADGLITTQGRRGSFVRSETLDGGRASVEAREAARSFVSRARSIGLSLAETTRLVEEAWSGS